MHNFTEPREWFHTLATDYVLAQIYFHLSQEGVFSTLSDGKPYSVSEMADRQKLNGAVLEPLLRYISMVDALVSRDTQGRYQMTAFGQKVLAAFGGKGDQVGQYNLFNVRVGAYGPVWQNIGDLLTGRKVYGRDLSRAGDFAANAVYHFSGSTLPAFESAIQRLGPSSVVEFGATSSILSGLAKKNAALGYFGLDRSKKSLKLAEHLAAGAGVTSVKWVESDVFDIPHWKSNLPSNGANGASGASGASGALFFSFHFHEILAVGPERFVKWLQELRLNFKGSWLGVVEVTEIEDRSTVTNARWLYGASDMLIHHLIGNGRILTDAQWQELLVDQVGLRLVSDIPTEMFGARLWIYDLN